MKKAILFIVIVLIAASVNAQRAVNSQIKIAEGTGSGSDGYISLIELVGNTMNVTGTLNAFSGSITNFANTQFGNVYTQPQTVPYSVYGPSWNGSYYVPTMAAIYEKIEALTFAHSSLTGLDYASSGHTDFAGTQVANTFTLAQTVPYVAYGASWLDNNNVPTMAALYEKIETITPSYISNVSLSGNNLTFTKVGSAYGGTIGNIANLAASSNRFANKIEVGDVSTQRTFINEGNIVIRSQGSPYMTFQEGLTTYGTIQASPSYFIFTGGATVRLGETNPTFNSNKAIDISTADFTFHNLSSNNTGYMVTFDPVTDKIYYFDASSGGSTYWETYASGIRPTSTAYEVYMGNIADQGAYTLQIGGALYSSSSGIFAGDVYGNIIDANTGFVGGYGDFADYIYAKQEILDKDGDAGTANQYLASTVTGVDWKDLPAGSGFWTQSGGALYPTTLTNEVRVGDDFDHGDYAFQVSGGAGNKDSYFSGMAFVNSYLRLRNASFIPQAGIPTGASGDAHVFHASVTNTMHYINTSGTRYEFDITTYSDYWRKKDFKRMSGSLNKILSLNTYEYNFKDNDECPEEAPTSPIPKDIGLTDIEIERSETGVIAQEIEDIIPEAVKTIETGYKMVDYDKIIPYLINAIQEQQKQIEELKGKLDNK